MTTGAICARHRIRVGVLDQACNDPGQMLCDSDVCGSCSAIVVPCTTALLELAEQEAEPTRGEIESAMSSDGWYMNGKHVAWEEP